MSSATLGFQRNLWVLPGCKFRIKPITIVWYLDLPSGRYISQNLTRNPHNNIYKLVCILWKEFFKSNCINLFVYIWEQLTICYCYSFRMLKQCFCVQIQIIMSTIKRHNICAEIWWKLLPNYNRQGNTNIRQMTNMFNLLKSHLSNITLMYMYIIN